MKQPNRLGSSREFRRVFDEGRSVARPEIVLYYSARLGANRPRFGFVVGRKVGGAVVRNRVRRRLREASKNLILQLKAPADIVIIAREPARRAGLADLQRALEETAARAGLIETPPEPYREGTPT